MNLHQDDAATVLRRIVDDPRCVDDLGRLLEVLVNERLSTSSGGRVARFGDLLRRHRRAADLTQEELGRRAQVPNVHPHRFRHDTARRLVESVDLPTVAAWLGHERL